MLGTLEVLDAGGRPVELRGSKLRTLLAALILHAGQPVSADQLSDLLWGDSPPSGAANALQAQISKLRRLLTGASLEGRDGGYVLTIDAQQVDAERFSRLAKTGHDQLAAGRHEEAAAVLRESLALWRGAACWPTSPSRSSPKHLEPDSKRCGSRRSRIASTPTSRWDVTRPWPPSSRAWFESTGCASGCGPN